jgi:hypothetical protein
MICPVMSIIGSPEQIECLEQKCAWWVMHLTDRTGECAITMIAEKK